MINEQTNEQLPLATFLEKHGRTAGDFVKNIKHLKKRYYPETLIIRHATFLTHYIGISEHACKELGLNVDPIYGANLEYTGSNTSNVTLWKTTDGTISVIGDDKLTFNHTKFTYNNFNDALDFYMESSKEMMSSVWEFVQITLSAAKLTEQVYLNTEIDDGWGILAVSSESDYFDVVEFLKDGYGDESVENGWLERRLMIGECQLRYAIAQLSYKETDYDAITNIAFRFEQKFGGD